MRVLGFEKFCSILLFLLPGAVWAQSASLGTVASHLTDATDVFTGVFSAMFYVIGIAMVAASVMRYRDYRQNPLQTPISRVVFLLLAGLIIGFFPLMINYISASIAHT
jgi:RsiW-degrading membrane proteinase PrsW (M82 family)